MVHFINVVSLLTAVLFLLLAFKPAYVSANRRWPMDGRPEQHEVEVVGPNWIYVILISLIGVSMAQAPGIYLLALLCIGIGGVLFGVGWVETYPSRRRKRFQDMHSKLNS